LESIHLNIVRANSENTDFRELVTELDKDLAIRDGDDHAFYSQFNKIDKIKYAIVAFENDEPVGCGAFKEYEPGTVEIKRMYVKPQKRGKGIAITILNELQQWAKEIGYQQCILETGQNQPEAITLYKKNGFTVTPNYGQYKNIENSICFKKVL
jgi:putative acetyltransferase